MARAKGIEPALDLRPAIEMVGLKQVIDQVGLKEVIKQVGVKEFAEQIGIPNLIAELGPDPDFRHARNRVAGCSPGSQTKAKKSPKSQQPDEAPED